jgi:hypothetical protein
VTIGASTPHRRFFLNPHCLINHKSRRLVGDTVQLRRRQVVCAAIVDAISMTSLKAGTA